MNWIKFDKNNPPKHYQVLIYGENGVEVADFGIDNGEYYFHNGTAKVDGVTYWMAFPEAPDDIDE